MKKSIIKIILILLIVGLNWAGLSAIIDTFAYFNDTETSLENTFTAGTLDISADGLGNFSLNLNPNNQAARNVMVGNDGSLGVKYLVEASDLEGDLCNYLDVEAKLEGDVKYNDNLVDLLSEIVEVASSTPNKNWNFKISFSGDEDEALDLDGGACQFNFYFKAWQTNMDEYNEGSGFTDQEKVFTRVSLRVPHALAQDYVVLNEFLPNPLGDDYQDGLQGEWVELYNNSPDQSFNLAGWYIEDEANHQIFITDSNTYNNSSVIGAKGSGNEWLVVFMNTAVLNNEGGDTVKLFDDNNNLVDSYTYSGSVPENKSYARYPDGTGTWYDPIPTPGGPNRIDEPENNNSLPELENNDLPLEDADENTNQEEEQQEEIIEEADIPEESITEEPVIEDTLIIEEASGEEENNEEIIINEPVVNEPAIEQEPVVVPNNDSGQPGDSGDDSGSDGDASANEGSGDTIETSSE